MSDDLLYEIIKTLDIEHLRLLVRLYGHTDFGPAEILKSAADQERFFR